MLKHFRENSVSVAEAGKFSEEELESKIVVGEFVRRERPTLVQTARRVIEEAKASGQ